MSPNRDELNLRIIQALIDKRVQYLGNDDKKKGWLGHGRVRQGVPYIIAVNLTGIPFYNNPLNIKDLEGLLFGLGKQVILYNKEDHSCITDYEIRVSMANHKGSEVRTDFFLQEESRIVSAVIFSYFGLPVSTHGHAYNDNIELLIHNPNALNPLPRGIFNNIEEEI